ncbi:hypothetical protein AR689_12595 [Arthrobacter sp. EpRS71]|nr:hypothetical protein AR689_12595 [Arthrobacter sp. EpRS71]
MERNQPSFPRSFLAWLGRAIINAQSRPSLRTDYSIRCQTVVLLKADDGCTSTRTKNAIDLHHIAEGYESSLQILDILAL